MLLCIGSLEFCTKGYAGRDVDQVFSSELAELRHKRSPLRVSGTYTTLY